MSNNGRWVFAAPTVIIAIDFVWTTSFHAGHGVDHAHYIVQFIWVRGAARAHARACTGRQAGSWARPAWETCE